eukprot:7972113-Alexandrium_andersonii.AAC.1
MPATSCGSAPSPAPLRSARVRPGTRAAGHPCSRHQRSPRWRSRAPAQPARGQPGTSAAGA